MELSLKEILLGEYRFAQESFISSTLTTIIEQWIFNSSLENEYLSAQPLILNDIEYELPGIRNEHLEDELLHQNENSVLLQNPFNDQQDLENYLNHCQRKKPTDLS